MVDRHPCIESEVVRPFQRTPERYIRGQVSTVYTLGITRGVDAFFIRNCRSFIDWTPTEKPEKLLMAMFQNAQRSRLVTIFRVRIVYYAAVIPSQTRKIQLALVPQTSLLSSCHCSLHHTDTPLTLFHYTSFFLNTSEKYICSFLRQEYTLYGVRSDDHAVPLLSILR